MKAIILCAGEGKRLRPLTNDRPKCLVEYNGRPILDYTLEAFEKNDIKDIIIVTGYQSQAILNHLRPGRAKFVLNPDFASSNMVHSLFCAQSEFDQDLVVSYGDIVFEPKVLGTLLAADADFAVVIDKDWQVLWKARMEDPLSDAETLKLSEKGDIVELGKKPNSLDEIQGQYIGLFKIRRALLSKVQEFYHSLDRNGQYDGKDFKNIYMTTFIQLIIDRLVKVKAVPIDGGWIEIDSPSDLEVDFRALRKA